MIEYLKIKDENKIEKTMKSAETRMAVYIYIYIYIVYCHLENKKALVSKFVKFNNKIKDRTILKVCFKKNILDIVKNPYFSSIGLSFCVFCYK